MRSSYGGIEVRKGSSPRGVRSASLIAALLAAATLRAALSDDGLPWNLEEPRPAVAIRAAIPVEFAELTCRECHAEIVDEWSTTAHALSWVDEAYREKIEDRKRPQLCHACHIPEPLLQAGLATRAKARAGDKHLGVSCESCHLGPDGTMLGPHGIANDAHPSQRSKYMVGGGSNALCITCHATNIGPVVGVAKDFVSSRQADRGRSCVGCHMATLESEGADSGTDGQSPAPRARRSHALQTPRDPSFLRRAFVPSLIVEGGKARVVVRNGAGHRVPGLLGREIHFAAEALGSAGEVVARGELTIDSKAYLPVDGSLEISLGALGDEVRLVGQHLDPRASKPVSFLDVRLSPDHR